MATIRFSAFADEYSARLDEQLAVLTRLGYSYLEPRGVDGKNISCLTDEDVHAMKQKLDASGLAVDSVGSPLGKIKLSDDFAGHMELTRRTCEIACALGAKRIRVFSFYLNGESHETAREQVLDRLGHMLDVADRYGVVLCHENEAGIYGESPDACLDLMKNFAGRLRCVFDMGNFVLGGYYPFPQAYRKLKPYIDYFHIKDTFPNGTIVPPGCGEADIAAILGEHLREAGDRDVIISLEPHLHAFVGLDALTTRPMNLPYSYVDGKEAFLDAASRLGALVNEL